MQLTLKQAAEMMGAPISDGSDVAIEDVSIDTRTMRPGSLFFALGGDQFDGHAFVEKAFRQGACGAVVRSKWNESTDSKANRVLLRTNDPLLALHNLASAYRSMFDIPVIGVTGSNGKTTTKEMIAAVLAEKHSVMKSSGNLNNHIGLPLSLCKLNQDATVAILEMGINHFDEMKQLCEIARPTHGVITNIGKSHLEFLGDLDGVARAKGEMLDYLSDNGTAFLNGDDPHLARMKGIASRTITFGFSDGCHVTGRDRGVDVNGCPQLELDGCVVTLAVPGRHNLYNALAAVAVARAFDVPEQSIFHALTYCSPLSQRMERLEVSGVYILNDAYNANPSSVRAALLALQEISEAGRRIVVLGDMLELGESARVEHSRVGELIAEVGVCAFFCFGPEMQFAAQRARDLGVREAIHFESKQDLVEALRHVVHKGDVVLVKGSRGMRMEEVVEGLRNALQQA